MAPLLLFFCEWKCHGGCKRQPWTIRGEGECGNVAHARASRAVPQAAQPACCGGFEHCARGAVADADRVVDRGSFDRQSDRLPGSDTRGSKKGALRGGRAKEGALVPSRTPVRRGRARRGACGRAGTWTRCRAHQDRAPGSS